MSVERYLCRIQILPWNLWRHKPILLAKRAIDYARLKDFHYIQSCIYQTIMNEMPWFCFCPKKKKETHPALKHLPHPICLHKQNCIPIINLFKALAHTCPQSRQVFLPIQVPNAKQSKGTTTMTKQASASSNLQREYSNSKHTISIKNVNGKLCDLYSINQA